MDPVWNALCHGHQPARRQWFVYKGVLSGLVLTGDLTELVACKEAMAYATLNPFMTTIWTDSA